MDERDTKMCELPGCEEFFTRPSWVGRPEFAKRKYHNRTCAERSKQGRPRTGTSVIVPAAFYQPRYNAEGVWRPNAPGWPDVPRVPVRA
jgi:hypothetical protein